jgi:DNA-binding CsgD family transcriptional regulator
MAGSDLSDRDVQAMMRLLRRYDPLAEDEVLPGELAMDLLDLIPCDESSIVGQDSVRRSIFAAQGLGEFTNEIEEPDDPFWVAYPDSLPCSYPCRSGDIASVTKISDFYSVRQHRNTAMYDHLSNNYDRFDHEIMVCLPVGPAHTRTLRLLFFREAGRDFSDRDRAVLTLLRPHLHAAYLAARQSRAGLTPLTTRQREIMQYVAAGYTNYQIARRLHLSEGTVRKHLENAFTRLQATNRAGAIAAMGPDLWTGADAAPLSVQARATAITAGPTRIQEPADSETALR